jgi:2-oxoisovalerate dehydrogenase E2 component (dihydrolipoyl transacylase)
VSLFVFKLPDLGEGTVEAELLAWHVKPGDQVAEDQIIAEVMTDKAAVELPSPVTGRVLAIAGQAGDKLQVGAELIRFETGSAASAEIPATRQQPPSETETRAQVSTQAPTQVQTQAPTQVQTQAPAQVQTQTRTQVQTQPQARTQTQTPTNTRGSVVSFTATAAATAAAAMPMHSASRSARVMASPATRRRAREAGIDLKQVHGSGPGGRIFPRDLSASLRAPDLQVVAPVAKGGGTGADAGTSTNAPRGTGTGTGTEEIKVIGLRRVIAQRMSEAKRTIPHFSYVEEVDVTELESLRSHLNSERDRAASLSYLPFIIAALVRALQDFPQCNAHYDAERGVIVRHRAIHVGIATQTPDGLLVPVLRHAESLSITQIAAEVRRLAGNARDRKSPREELTGSTITVSNLGKLGGIASTPVINAPEVAIIGVNNALERPVIQHGAIVVRRMMNLSSSFDHRFVDGFDAAAMIQALKSMLEHPATIFI